MKWKAVLLSFVLLLALSVGLAAKFYSYSACSLDNWLATLAAEFVDPVDESIVVSVGAKYGAVANALTAEQLIGPKGFQMFRAQLTEQEYRSFSLTGPPVIGAQCRVASK